jgi:hypothetical protein
MNLRDLLNLGNLGKIPAKIASAATKAPGRAAAKGLRGALRRPRSTPQDDAAKARERAADRAIVVALEGNAKDELPRKP